MKILQAIKMSAKVLLMFHRLPITRKTALKVGVIHSDANHSEED
ncbi:hypothetical protein [Nodularia spumigena]|nr:hypothetical protein [Nodularia spumigena]AHJ28628.1 hypothetical protein NSP_22970 [Nodularia spumigena CCY9414]